MVLTPFPLRWSPWYDASVGMAGTDPPRKPVSLPQESAALILPSASPVPLYWKAPALSFLPDFSNKSNAHTAF